MRKAKVWNDGDRDHTENFKGDLITIPSNGFVEMEFYDAHEFKSQYCPIRKTPDGGPDPESCKKIRVEAMPEETKASEKPTHICQACAYGAMSSEDLEDHIDRKHLDQLAEKDVAEKRKIARAKKSA